MRIILAVDGSESSINATRTLVAHVDWFRDRTAVRLVNVQPAVPRIGGSARPRWREALEKHYAANGDKALAAAQAMLDEAGVKYSSAVLAGEPAQAIVAEAEKENCDLIYMGTRGLSAIGNLLLGSVTTKVLHLSKTPVILVR